MKTKDFLTQNIDKSRQQMRATEFIRLNKNSLQLAGKNVGAFLAAINLNNRTRKAFEVISLDDADKIKRLVGDMVTEGGIFTSSDNIVWEKDDILFMTADGITVSSYQYDYINKYGIGGNQFFAKSNSRDSDVSGTWKTIIRKAQEARKDKAKEILYITVGSVSWLPDGMKKQCKSVASPLFFCAVKEESNSKDKPRFRVVGDAFKINTILGREIKKQLGVDIFANCEKEFSFEKVLSQLETVKDNVSSSPAEIWFGGDDINLCVLDSSNETICQAVEKNMDVLAASPLVKVLSGECAYQAKPRKTDCGLYPLLADDSQREVIWEALSGNSVNVAAAAGTGKSQTMVNIAANMAALGKTVCVMSEKAAANEVFIKYAKHVGLDKYCLVINNKMSVSEIIGQVKGIVNMPRLYVDAVKAREAVAAKREVEDEFSFYGSAVYDDIPGINRSLYDLIGEATAYDPCLKSDSLHADKARYMSVTHKLNSLQNSLLKTMSESEYSDYVASGKTGDSELDDMLSEEIVKLQAEGIDLLTFIRDNQIGRNEVAGRAVSNIARMIAADIVLNGNVSSYGNRRLKSMYGKLTNAYSRMTSLSAAFMVQEVSARVQAIAKSSQFVQLLDRLKTSRITLQDLFKTYGKDILELCPIIVTTPATAVCYITNEMNTFDVLMIDEASQVPITSVLPFLVGDRQLITFGDNMQLDITSYFTKSDYEDTNEDDEFELALTDKSILHVVQGKNIPNCQLKYHYRSKTEQLLKVSNMTCYDNTLSVVPDVYTSRLNLPKWLGYEVVSIQNPETTANGSNLSEARAIADRAAELKRDTPEKTIGVIAFNDKQQNLIIDELEERKDSGLLDCDFDSDGDIWVRSLENAQGKEADVILICIGHYARNKKDGSIRKGIADLNKAGGENRLNVLFTRAREKNIIFLSFDYRELKESDNPNILRLYQYLDYAATGAFTTVEKEASAAADKLNDNMTAILGGMDARLAAYPKVGQNDLMVDVAVVAENGRKYEMGILLSNRLLSTNAIWTKVNILERAGWNVVPASPIYLLEKKDKLQEQMRTAISEPSRLGSVDYENFITEIPQTSPISVCELMNFEDNYEAASTNAISQITPITETELSSIDFVSIYSNVRNGSIFMSNLPEQAKSGDTLATLLLLVKKLPALINQGKLQEAITKVHWLYINKGEKLSCYLLAQMLRTQKDFEMNEPIITALLEESKTLHLCA